MNSKMALSKMGPRKIRNIPPLISKIKNPGLIQMLLLLDLLLLLLLYVFNYVLIRGREAPPYNYVMNTYSRSSSSISRSNSTANVS